MASFYLAEELEYMGFKQCGKNVLISKKASFYGVEDISIGDNVRIDDFCILSGNIKIHNYVHIAPYCALFAGVEGIEMKDYSGLSSRCIIYAGTDDYSGEALTNPTVPEQYRKVTGGKVVLGKHVIIGTGTSILPGVTIEEGSAVGSMSLVNKMLEPWGIYAGIPCKKVKERKRDLLELARDMEEHKDER